MEVGALAATGLTGHGWSAGVVSLVHPPASMRVAKYGASA